MKDEKNPDPNTVHPIAAGCFGGIEITGGVKCYRENVSLK